MSLLRRLVFLALACSAARAHRLPSEELAPHSDDPLHQLAELYVDSYGAFVEYTVELDGRLHVWATSAEIDPSLTLERPDAEAMVDLDSGRGDVAWFAFDVRAGDELLIEVGSETDEPGTATLHVIAVPETDATRVAAAQASEALATVAALQQEGDLAGAADELFDAIDRLERTPGSEHSELLADALGRSGQAGYGLSAFDLSARGFLGAHERATRFLPPDHSSLTRMKQNSAIACLWSQDLTRADELFGKVLEIQTRLLPPDHAELLTAQQNYAITRQRLGDSRRAYELYEHVHSTRARTLGPDHFDTLRSLVNVATAKLELRDIEGAHADFEHVHSVWERELAPDHLDFLRAKSNLALTSRELGDLKRAAELAEVVHATRVRLLPPEHPEVIGAKQSLAGIRRRLGDIATYRKLSEEVYAVQVRTLPEGHPYLVLAQQNMGLAHLDHGELEDARQFLQHVHDQHSRRLPSDHPDLISAKMNLAVTLRWLLDIEGALELDEQVHEALVASLDADHPDVLGAKQNLAASRSGLGDHEGALELQEYVEETYERIFPPDHPDLLTSKQNLAITRKLLGDNRGALELEEYVLSARERLLDADHPDLLSSQQNLALTRQALGDLDGALELFELVMAARRDFPDEHPDRLDAVMNLALVHYALGDPGRANEGFEEVYAARRQFVSAGHPVLLNVQQDLAAVRTELGDLEGARAMLPELLQGQMAAAARLSTASPREARSLAEGELERLASATYVRRILNDERNDPALDAGVFEVLETLRSVVTSAASRARAARSYPELQAGVNDLAVVRQLLADATWSTPESADGSEAIDAWRERVLTLSEERDRLQSELLEKLSGRGLDLGLPRLAEVAAGLDEDAALVSFWRYPRAPERDPVTGDRAPAVDSFLAFVVQPSGRIDIVELGPAEPIEALIFAWRAEQGHPLAARGIGRVVTGGADVVNSGERLRGLLLDPVLTRTGEVQALHVVLDDCLHLLPLEALPHDGTVLGESFRIRNEPNVLRLMSDDRTPLRAGNLVALGGVDYEADVEAPEAMLLAARGTRSGPSEQLTPLPGAKAEVESLTATFQALFDTEPVLLTGAAATKSALLEAVEGARWVHLATHGWFAPESVASRIDAASTDRNLVSRTQAVVRGFAPETLCGLALAGANRAQDERGAVHGILTAEELGALDFSNCELAVLSACETNVGLRRAGQGIQSLQTALHAAGARTAITSLWKVDDEATRELFERFYQELWTSQRGKADALWRAKMALRASGRPVSDWAGWILTGDPD